MPFLAPIIGAVAGVLGAVGVISSLAATLITLAVTIISTILTKTSKAKVSQGTELKLKLDASMPRQVAVGFTATGGSSVWAFTCNAPGDSGIPNKFLYRVVALSDVPVNGVVRIMEGKETLTFDGDVTAGWYSCNQHKHKDGAPAMTMQLWKGGNASGGLHADLVSKSGGLWTSAHKGTGIAHAIMRYAYDPDAFPNGEPSLVFVVQGASVYDDRITDWAYSENTCNVLAQYMRGFHNGDQLMVGVQAEEADLSIPHLISGYNICDEGVDSLDGTVPRYRCGRMLSANEQAADAIDDLRLAMDGKVLDRGGEITLIPGAVRTPSMNLTDDDIIWAEEKSWQPQSSQTELFNFLSGQHIDGATGFDAIPYPPLKNSTWEVNDGGERFSKSIDFSAVPYRTQAIRTATRIHKSSRFQDAIGFIGPLWLMELEQGDTFTLTSARWGMTTKLFECTTANILMNPMRCMIAARETSATIDEWGTADEPLDDTTQWSPGAFTYMQPTFYLTSTTQYTPFGTEAALGITVTAPLNNPAIVRFESEIAYCGYPSHEAGPALTPSVPSAVIVLNSGTCYAMRVRSVDLNGVTSAWSNWEFSTTPVIEPKDGTNNIPDPFDLAQAELQSGAIIEHYPAAGPRIVDKHRARLIANNSAGSGESHVVRWCGLIPVTENETWWYAHTAWSDHLMFGWLEGGFYMYDAQKAFIGYTAISGTGWGTTPLPTGTWVRKKGSFVIPTAVAYIQPLAHAPHNVAHSFAYFYVGEPYTGRAEPGATYGAPVGSPVGWIDASDVANTINGGGGGVANNKVVTQSIVDASVNAVSTAYTTANIAFSATTWTTIQSVGLTVLAGASLCAIKAGMSFRSVSTTGGGAAIRILRDGIDITGGMNLPLVTAEAFGVTYYYGNFTGTLSFSDNPGGGWHWYEFQIYSSVASPAEAEATHRYMEVINIKR